MALSEPASGTSALPPLVEPAAELTKDEVARYSRHLIIPDVGMTGQKRLKNAKVLVVGAGGLGSPALLYLAAAGVGTLGIVEFDEVDESNLHRQVIHGQSDIGRPKGESARDSIREINPFVEVVLHPVRLDSSNVLDIFRDYDLILDGTDNFATRYLVNDAAVLLGKPYVWGSIFRFEGQASVFWEDAPNGRGLNYRDLYPEPPPPGMVPSCAEGGVLGVLCASIGSIMVNEAIKLITGIGEPLLGRLMVYDALEMSYRTIRLRKDPETGTDHRADRLRRLLRRGVRRRAGRGGRPHDHGHGAQGDDGRGQGLRAHRRPRAARVRDRAHPRLGARPEGPHPVR
jgi:adenylyltransferase/sulfurtransferase